MDKSWKIIVAFVAVFMAGTVFGGFFALRLARQFEPRERPRPMAAVVPGGQVASPPATQLWRRFAERLELTDEQRVKLRPIVMRTEAEIGRLRQSSLEQTNAVLNRMQQEFSEELTPVQRRMLERMQQAQRENLRRERARRQQPDQPQSFGPGPAPRGPHRPGGPNRPANQFREGQRPGFRPPDTNQPPEPGPPRYPGDGERAASPPPPDQGGL